MSKAKPAALPPDTMIGGYRIIRKVAAGGFGVVYLALDADGQQVAVRRERQVADPVDLRLDVLDLVAVLGVE